MSSYFWFHWATQLPGGILTHHYGTKVVLGVANFLSAVTTFVIPFAAKWGFNALMGLRVLQGVIAVMCTNYKSGVGLKLVMVLFHV